MERRRMAGTINKCITGHEMFFIYVLKSYSTADWCSQRISEDKVLNHSKGLRILFSLSSLLNLVYTPLDQSLSLHFISGSLPTPPITRGLRWLSSTPTSESISFSLSPDICFLSWKCSGPSHRCSSLAWSWRLHFELALGRKGRREIQRFSFFPRRGFGEDAVNLTI